MIKQNTTIKLRPDQFEVLKEYGTFGDKWPDVIDKVLKLAMQSVTSPTSTEFKTAIVDKYGKASISRTLAGKTIEYRVRESQSPQ